MAVGAVLQAAEIVKDRPAPTGRARGKLEYSAVITSPAVTRCDAEQVSRRIRDHACGRKRAVCAALEDTEILEHCFIPAAAAFVQLKYDPSVVAASLLSSAIDLAGRTECQSKDWLRTIRATARRTERVEHVDIPSAGSGAQLEDGTITGRPSLQGGTIEIAAAVEDQVADNCSTFCAIAGGAEIVQDCLIPTCCTLTHLEHDTGAGIDAPISRGTVKIARLVHDQCFKRHFPVTAAAGRAKCVEHGLLPCSGRRAQPEDSTTALTRIRSSIFAAP